MQACCLAGNQWVDQLEVSTWARICNTDVFSEKYCAYFVVFFKTIMHASTHTLTDLLTHLVLLAT